MKDTKIGLETLAEMGYDPRAITLVLNRADSSVGITRWTWSRYRPRAGRPRRQRPGDPRALTNGQPITVADPKSKAPGRTQRWRSGTWRFRTLRWPRPLTTGGGVCCCGRRADDGTARADRKLSGRAGAARRERQRRRRRDGSICRPEKNRIHLALVSELGPRLFDVEDSGAVRALVESEIGEQLSQEAGKTTGRGLPLRSPTTSSAMDR